MMLRLTYLFLALLCTFSLTVGACSPTDPGKENTTEASQETPVSKNDASVQETQQETGTTETQPEPTIEAVIEIAPEPKAEPSVEPSTEPSVEPSTEPSVEPSVEPGPEPKPEPVKEPAAEVVVEDASTPKESAPEATPRDEEFPTDCKAILALYNQELQSVRSCQKDSDCGKALTGTSCGCTRNKVANTSANTTRFYAIIAHAQSKQCSLPLISTCDCPKTNGFQCTNNQCAWNYGP